MAAEDMEDELSDDRLMWQPPTSVDNHQLEIVRKNLNQKHGLDMKDYNDLHRFSVEKYDIFWSEMWDRFGIICSRDPEETVDKSAPMENIPKWFRGAKMNYAENLLKYKNDDEIALFYTSERINETGIGQRTFGQVRKNVARIAASLRVLGITVGDRVAGYMPNCPEAIEIMAAVSSIGAVWSSTSPDFGVSGVLDRFRQIEPRLIFSVEAVAYNSKIHDHFGKLRSVVNGLSSVDKVIVIPFCRKQKEIRLEGPKEMFMSEFVEEGSNHPNGDRIRYEQLPFDHPLFIMYSSGTTGKPKCIVHGQGGTLMKHLCEHMIMGNRSEKDTLFQYTTVGWMMWNWMVSSMALGTTLVLYDGSPLHPHQSIIWDLADKCGVTVLGTSAKWIAVQEEKGIKPRLTHDLRTLRTICSTASPLKPSSYDYVYRDIKTDVMLSSITGGTDIIACFMGEISIMPVHRGEIQGKLLGCAIECWDDAGCSVEGVPGELVCTVPFPSMPVTFWNDDGKVLYRRAYFDKFPGVWAHGDFISINPKTKGILMLGRSDGTLNPNGVRFGSAEIYNVVETFPEIADSVCVGQKSRVEHEERVVLFLKMEFGHDFSEEIVAKVKEAVRMRLSARHVPALVLPIDDIPYTVNGKKVEVAVKKVLAGLPIANLGALANPESLELFKNIPETHKW